MQKNEYLVPVGIVLLSIVFSVVCFMVFISKGKSAYWISRKMRVGGLLLTLTALMNLNHSCDRDKKNAPMVNCYDVMPEMYISLEKDTVYMNNSNLITGSVYGYSDNTFSYNITDTSSTISLQKGLLVAKDGQFNGDTEAFEIALDSSLKTGRYVMKVFSSPVEDQISPIDVHYFEIVNEN